jgi:hypothetical protein
MSLSKVACGQQGFSDFFNLLVLKPACNYAAFPRIICQLCKIAPALAA